MYNLVTIISGIGTVQSILFALLIIVKKKRSYADWVLLSWFLVFAIHLIIIISKSIQHTNVLEIFTMTIGFLPAPFFFLYTKAIFKQHLNKIDFAHFLPFLIFTISSFFISQESALTWEITILIFKLSSVTIYPLYILIAFHRKSSIITTKNSTKWILEFSWIKIIAYIFLISTLISVLRLSTELIAGVRYFEIWDMLRYVILITVLGFFGLKYGMVYKPEVPHLLSSEEKKYKHSPLNNDEIARYKNQIKQYFKNNNSYLQPDFSLAILSESLNIPKHHLSQIINSEMQTSFYDMINSKRVAYAREIIKNGNKLNLTLEGLGYECGFNSKSAFFNHFKKYTGKTPGQFKKEISSD